LLQRVVGTLYKPYWGSGIMNIKKILTPMLLLSMGTQLYANNDSSCDCNPYSRSYLATKPYFMSASPERVSAFRDERIHARENGRGMGLQLAVFGAKSRNEENLAHYFSSNCSTCMQVREQIAEEFNRTTDLLAQHFNIFTQNGDFSSKIGFAPQQSAIGLGFEFRQGFWRNEEKNRGFFYDISTALVRVKNDMNLCERIINNGGGPNPDADEHVVANMTEAFRQSEWCFGKICGAQSKTGLSDIEVKAGYEWLQHKPYHLESYLGIIIPTGNKAEAKYLFEPIVGNGRHFGVTFGSAVGFQIWEDVEKDRLLRVEYAIHTEYLFGNTQKRMFDLNNKPWSRYMEVYANKEQAQQAADLGGQLGANLATPGINVFTRDAKVTPGIAHTHNTAFVLTCKGFQGEAGYNYFARTADCVKLACGFPTTIALKDKLGDGQTNPVRNITGNSLLNDAALAQPLDNYDQNVIRAEDIDLNSGAQPCYVINTLYAALGYRWDTWRYPFFVNGGGSYEWTSNSNAALDRWIVWAKCGFSF